MRHLWFHAQRLSCRPFRLARQVRYKGLSEAELIRCMKSWLLEGTRIPNGQPKSKAQHMKVQPHDCPRKTDEELDAEMHAFFARSA